MKVSIVALLVLLGLSFVCAEIVPRFPGEQPLFFYNVQSNVTSDVTEFKRSIDSFEYQTQEAFFVVLTEDAPPVVTQSRFDFDPTTILGSERDIIIIAEEGSASSIFTAGVSANTFSFSTGATSRASNILQYDGIDNGDQNLNTNPGLGGVDLTLDNASGFLLRASADIEASFTLTVVDSNGNSASASAVVVGDQTVVQDYNVPFSSFTGVDFTSVAAIQFEAGGATPGVDFLLDIFGTYGNVVVETSNCFEGTVAPCDTDYYRLQDIINVVPGDYITIDYEYLGEPANPFSGANLYVLNSKFYDLQSEVAVNTNIKDTLGGLPGPKLYDYRCNGTCEIEIVWSQLKNNSYYYLAVEGTGPGYTNYEFCLNRRNVSIRRLSDSVSFPVFSDQRPTVPPRDTVLNYSYFAINVPQSIASEGTYLVVNISRAQPFPGLRLSLMHESLPGTPNTTGVISQVDINSYGKQLDNEIFPYCVDTTGSTFYENPRSDQPRIPCTCFTQVQLFGTTQTFQLTCNLTVDPCHFKYGTWYASVELPERSDPENPLDDSGIADYTLTAIVVQPSIVTLFRNSTFVGAVDAEAMTHYRLVVGAADITPGQSHLIVQISNIRNGAVNVFVHKGQGNLGQLAGPEGCSPANVTCTTSDACNLVVEKCHFSAGTWYIGVSVSETDASFDIFDEERAPITYTIRANWVVDAEPTRLTAGVPVSRSIGEALYDFYVINVPTTIDTWLFVELYAKAQDTEVIISMLHGSLPGGDCYARPDFYCMTGDPTETRVSTGPPTFLDNEPVQRESCSFMIQTCELQAGPLYISVYGQHAGYAVYSDTTYYQVPVQYTLWADFDVALPVASGVAYSETVSEKQYQHYYIRADDVPEGSWLSVEVTNIQHGIPQTLETFVNYNFLAGDCPCYDNLYNCTGDAFSLCPAGRNFAPRILPAEQSVLNCCTIIVPPSDFKSGVWYIGILGVNEDLYQYTTPIGYTLTVTIHDAPMFNPLILGQEQTYVAPQYNETLEYVHFKLAAVPIYENDLVIKLTWVQSCDYMGKQDDGYWSYTPDALNMYVNVGAPAGANPTGNLYSCSAAVSSDSYCTIVIPHCEWVDEQYFIAVRGDYEAVFDARFTILATLDPVRSVNLTDNVPYYDRVAEGRYKHYFIETTAEESQYLNIDVYTNQDQDAVTVYLNKDVRAGDAPCFTNFDSCESNSFCTWQLLACDLSPGRYYISVRAANKQFYAVSTEFTILAAHKPVVTDLNSLFPVTGHLYAPGQVRHYSMEIDEDIPGTHIRFLVDNVQHGAVTAYLQYGALAGRCPCFVSEQSCSASSVLPGDGQEWCELRVPSCEVKQGTYFFSIFADELISPDPLAFITPIGFTVEIDVYAGDVETPEVDVGRNPSNIALYESVTETRYRHYEFDFDDEDFSDGYHVIVEISEVNGGSITAYYNPLVPGDFSDSCHAAEICTSGIADGTVCRWQLPHCLVRGANTPNKHYITIHGLSGRNIVFYHILIWKQPVPRVVSNPSFTLDGQTSSAEFPTNAEVNITHSKFNEPNGWTQFIRLQNVPARTDDRRGEMLELFFYRVQNNIGEPIAFNVYVAPNEPAGAHGCCDTSDPVEMASCQNAPCSQTADTTTQSTNGGEIFSHVCSLGTGAGHSSNNPFFGERCTVRVWPCEFNKYCGNETVDWFVSVVPIVATDPASTGNGLTYSFQWRTRDIRLFDSIPSVGTVDLTPEINNYDFGTEYTVRSFSSDDQGWRSFAISYAGESNQRLSIQTRFVSGTGVVYINRNEFASPTDSCNDYECTSTSNCDGENRFINTESCSDKGISYWITVRNTGVAQNSDLVVSFRITTIQLPEVIEIPSHPTRAFPFTYTSTFAPAYDNILGVQDENYNFFTLTIDDDDLDENRSWIIDIDRVGGDSDDTGALTVFIRFGEPAGNYGTSLVQNYYGNEIEGNFAWQYSCELPTPDSSCFFQIPHCNLVEGHWYISFYNAEVVLEGTPSALPQYTFTTYIDDVPTFIPLNTIVTANQNVADHDGHGAYLTHYRVNVTAEDLAYDNRADLEGYWTRWLRFQIQNLDEGDVVQVYINYDSLAGPIEEHSCLSHFATFSCESAATGCFYDVLPCEQDGSAIKLVSGSYFISILTTSGNFDNDYELVAQILQNEYSLITQTATVVGDGNRLGTENVYYSYTVSNGELNSNGDGFGHYRYVIDIPADADDDDLPDNEYLIFNISTPATVDGSSISFELWRDDCTRFNCETSGPESWCVIDALTLSPCSAKSGRYYMRVDNENAIEFTIEAFLNQTAVQTIEDRQILTEIIYPYEYQEYFYGAQEVGEGSTLTVRVCSLCGDVQVWLRADMPAGPSSSSNDCAIASCEASSVVSGDFDGADDDEQCCVIFLDSCEYAQRGYYVGIRGVDVEYPNDVNPFIYTPIRYNVEVYQTNINFTQVSPSCPSVVTYSEPAYIVPNQYFVDIETVNIGSSLRFSLRVPEGSDVTGDNEPTISVNYNTPVGYSNSDVCATDLLAFTCSSTTYCSFEIPYCAIPSTPRFYISTTAPRGSEILVERFDPIVSIIQPNINYQATINGPDAVADNFVVPYKPNKQYYRFDMAPWGDENFYERFYVRVVVSGVRDGRVSLAVNSGNSPYAENAGCDTPVFFASCNNIGSTCYVDIQYSDIVNNPDDKFSKIPKTFWVTIEGVEQNCELKSISYELIVQSHWVVTYFPVGKTICNNVGQDEYNFHRLKPHQVEYPQESILRFTINDIDDDEIISVLLQDSYLPTVDGNQLSESNFFSDTIEFDWICGYDDLYISVHGDDVDNDGADYRMNVEKVKVPVKELFDDSVYHHDDDDDDACPHDHDFYIFKTAQPRGHHAGSFFRVLVDSEFNTRVYVNKDTFAWGPCFDSGYGENNPEITGTTSVNVYDFCDFADGIYYITVVADGPYYIYTNIRDDAKNLTLGQVFRDELEPAMYQVYSLEICKDWYEADDRLVIEISDVQNGDVQGWIRKDGVPGEFQNDEETGSCASDTALARYGAGESGYDFLLVNSCQLEPGTYYILIRAAPHPGSPERNCQHVTYRLFPYLIDYQIDPIQVAPNTQISDTVDYYTINRESIGTFDPFIRYYSVDPLNVGFNDDADHAVVRLANVEGGLLRLRIANDHLAIPQNAYIEGEIYALTKSGLLDSQWKMQSGARPNTYQRVLDNADATAYSECDVEGGCANYCSTMSTAGDEYSTDSSIAIWLPSCFYAPETVYIAVEAVEQYYQDHPITYDLVVTQTRDYIIIQPDTNHLGEFSDNNWDYDFYYSISAEPESMRWRVVVTSGEGVLVTVHNHRCPLQSTWTKTIWCDAAYFDRPWLCDIEIATEAAHPGDNAFFLSVYGKNATYSIAFWRGRENCHDFTGAGRAEGLNFCSGLVPYATWRWDNYETLDNEASCFFDQLYQQFRVQPCYTGVTPECNSTLKAFACYESFHACDHNGFAVPTCRSSCNAVVYECANWFDSVDLEHYNCTSSRYADGNAGTCTGNDSFDAFTLDSQLFLGQPELILFKSSPENAPVSAASASVYSVALTLVFAVIVLII